MLTETRNTLKRELLWQSQAKDETVDIVIVYHNQCELVCRCLESIKANTTNYRLFLWDNNSDQIIDVIPYQPSVYYRSNENLGFIKPNNIMSRKGSSPYLILLNSDTVVHGGWKEALLGCLQSDENIGCCGYLGGKLDCNGIGGSPRCGSYIDYVMGWCMALSRKTLSELGGILFDECYEFAWCEDSDLSLRVKELGYNLYAINLNLVVHVGGATLQTLKDTNHLRECFRKNHEKLVKKWRHVIYGEEKK